MKFLLFVNSGHSSKWLFKKRQNFYTINLNISINCLFIKGVICILLPPPLQVVHLLDNYHKNRDNTKLASSSKKIFFSLLTASLLSPCTYAQSVTWDLNTDQPTDFSLENSTSVSLDLNNPWLTIIGPAYYGYAKPTTFKGTILNDVNASINLNNNEDLINLPEAIHKDKKFLNLDFINAGSIKTETGAIYKASNDLTIENFGFENKETGKIEIGGHQFLSVTASQSFIFVNDGEISIQGGSWDNECILYRTHENGFYEFNNNGIIRLGPKSIRTFLRVESVTAGKVTHVEITNKGLIESESPYTTLFKLESNVNAHLNRVRIPVRHNIFYAPARGPVSNPKNGVFLVDEKTRIIFNVNQELTDTTLNLYSNNINEYNGLFIGNSTTKNIVNGDVNENLFAVTDPQAYSIEWLASEEEPDNWEKAQIRVFYERKKDAGQQMNLYVNRLGRERGFRYSALIDPLKVHEQYNVFVRPYYAQSQYRFTDDSQVQANGLLMGMTAKVNEQFEHGLHFAAEHSTFTTSTDYQEAKTDSISLGYHALVSFAEQAYLKGNITATYGNSDLTYRTLDEVAKDDFANWSLFANARLGCRWVTDQFGTFVPELGVSYFYNKTDDITLRFAQLSSSDRFFRSESQSDVVVSPTVHWMRSFDTKDGSRVTPQISLGARVLVGDKNIESTTVMGDQRITSTIEDDRWQATAAIRMNVTSGSWEYDLSYSGAYGQNTTSQVAWLTVGYHW